MVIVYNDDPLSNFSRILTCYADIQSLNLADWKSAILKITPLAEVCTFGDIYVSATLIMTQILIDTAGHQS
ncbi:hypothetical protein CRP01_12795 [Flavilitoribacter nigricans DSM 23189 = NBRC 102662]|uniref:Uncharacterized protein n=1 Tax=Flavilitoribacter nigricans (strain ATCC 23147 / DSM 23189 / NBRC 102662 / NCIMB 1420 / SS-2) TaxID=1122177 RepID=A0A2D0NE31_FLAN2|nr:hypothetical protein CRP01_12795 [Flavilitoribacter nigricans DSM 23189 = NBRC 102662]